MRKLIVSMLAVMLCAPLVAEQEWMSVKMDVSKDPNYSASVFWPGGSGGFVAPLRTSAQITVYLPEKELPAGGMPYIDGIARSAYKAMLYMSENATTTTVLDHTINANNFTASVNTDAIDAAGYRGSGFTFNGSTQYMTRSDDADFDITALESFTVGFWFKQTANDSEELMARKGNGPGGWHCSMSANGKLRWLITSNGSDVDLIHSTTVCDDGGWHLYIGTKEAGDNIRLYVDGVEEGVTAITNSTGTLENTDDIEIAGPMDIAGQRWAESLDGFFFIKGDYPTATEVAAHYAQAACAEHLLYGFNIDGTTNTLLWTSGTMSVIGQYLDLTKVLGGYRGWIRFRSDAEQAADRDFKVYMDKGHSYPNPTRY